MPGVWRPSRLHRCMRLQMYKLFKVPKDPNPPFDFTTANQFMRGHLLGAYAAAMILLLEGRWGFRDIVCEDIAHDAETGLGGKKDVTFYRHGVKYIVEVKSKMAPIDDEMPAGKTDLLQLNDYMHTEGAEMGFLIYVGPVKRAGSKAPVLWFVEKPHRYSAQLWEQSKSRMLQLGWFRRDPTRLAPDNGSQWMECPTCPFQLSCHAEKSPADLRPELRR